MSTHNGYVKEFPFIRIDSFTSLSNPSTGLHPLYYFLTHAHTDHLTGLNSPSFRGTIYMTPVTRIIVANSMEASERVRWHEFRGEQLKRHKRKFDNLLRPIGARRESKLGSVGGASSKSRGMDQIKEINLNQPIKLDGPNVGDYVQVTAIDANHCPGSCMFLFEGVVDGSFRSCLVTGDLRAEPWYIDPLLHNPLLAPYTILTTTNTGSSRKGKERGREGEREGEIVGPTRELDCIYLDTSNVLLNEELVDKAVAIQELIEMIRHFPPRTKFFLNCWTWGYEELLKTIYRTFRGTESIHLDWYKYKIYTSTQMKQLDPLLSTLGTLSSSTSCSHPSRNEPEPSPSLHLPSTTSSSSTNSSSSSEGKGFKFHACERYWKCDQVWQDGRGCYTFPEEFLNLDHQNQPPDQGSKTTRSRECKGKGQEKKKLVRPGSGEYLKRDGTVGVRQVRQDQEEQQEEEEGLVIWVNPVEMMKWSWEEYRETTWDKIRRAKKEEEEEDLARGKRRKDAAGFPKSLLVPLARHSTLPELQRFVSIFRPKTLYPLTISTAANTREHPAREYLSMPALFEGMLAKGGEERLRREAREYVKNLKKGRCTGKVVTSSPDDEGAGQEGDGDRWFGDDQGGKWEEEMKKRGLNVEGGREVVEEVLKWSDRANRRDSEIVGARNGGVRDIEIDQVENEVVVSLEVPPVQPTSISAIHERPTIELGNRRLRYGDPPSQSIESSQVTLLVPSASSVLLPSALPPPNSTRPATPSTNPSRAPASTSTTTTTRTLRKSVTFAPSPTKSPELMLSARKGTIVPLKRSRSLPIPPSPVRTSDTHSVTSRVGRNLVDSPPAAPRPVPSTSATTSRTFYKPVDNSENVIPSSSSASRPPSNSASQARSKPREQQSILASLAEDSSHRAKLLLSLQRTLQGKIGPNGTIIPFSDREREELKKRERRFREQEKGKGKGKGKARENKEVEKERTGLDDEEHGMEEMETYESEQFETVLSSY